MEARLRVTVAHEGGPFLEQARAAGRNYPQLTIDEAELSAVEKEIGAYDVIYCPGESGRPLAELATERVGGAEWVAESRFGPDGAVFCPAHAADATNPVATILSAALALEYINEHQVCAKVRRGVETALADRPADLLSAILAAVQAG